MNDVFGKVLKDYQAGKDPQYRVLRDDGHGEKKFVSPEEYFLNYEEWDKPEKEIIKLARKKTLDIGAGAGKHALYLQNKGYDVKAVDISSGAVDVMRERGVEDVQLQDVNKLDFNEDVFDTILLMGNNLGLAGTVEKTLDLFERLAKMTKEDARIIGTTRDVFASNKEIHKKYQEKNIKTGKAAGQLKLRLAYKDEKGEWLDYLLFDRKQLYDLLNQTQWIAYMVTRNYDGTYGVVLKKE